MEKDNRLVCLNELMSSCVSLVHLAGTAIVKIQRENKFEVFEKAEENAVSDPQTEADITAQLIISEALSKTFPEITIIAEEGNSNPTHINPIFYPPNKKLLENDFPKDFQLELDHIIIWIDPMDGTKQFINKNLDAVTVLVGISYKGDPIAGIIGQPFNFKDQSEEFLVIWGINLPTLKLTKSNFGSIDTNPKNSPPNIIVTSNSKTRKKLVKDYLDRCSPSKILRMGGCGRKMLALIHKEAVAYIFPIEGTKKWDTCAPQAVLESLGGRLTTPKGKRLIYEENNIENIEGFIATIGVEHEKFLE